MKARASEHQKRILPSADKEICIVGSRRLQNELIAYYLKHEVDAKCQVYKNIRQLSLPDYTSCNDKTQLLLWDCLGKDPEEVLIELEFLGEEALSRIYLVLLNVTRDLGFEEKMVWKGVRGFFYEEDPLDQLSKGIRTVLHGELWLSREIVTKCILEGKGRDYSSKERKSIVTPREVEILVLVASWATNEEIAEQLFISPHTVKTHLYNIFKKIDVPNRFQAALWATKNLERFMLK